MLTVCPPPTEIADIPQSTCPVDFDQIIMAIFQRKPSGAAPFSPATIKLLATWTPMLSAVDDTKVVGTPKFAGLSFPQSAELSTGGNDNTTIAGIPLYNGEGNVVVNADIPSMAASIKIALKTLTQESLANQLGVTGLTVYFVNRFGQIVANQVDDTHVQGFDLFNLRFSTVGSAGFNARNQTQMGMVMQGNWDDNAVVITPAFDILSSIINTVPA